MVWFILSLYQQMPSQPPIPPSIWFINSLWNCILPRIASRISNDACAFSIVGIAINPATNVSPKATKTASPTVCVWFIPNGIEPPSIYVVGHIGQINVQYLIESDDDSDDYNNNIEENVKRLIAQHLSNLIQYLSKSVKTKVTTFLADNELSLVIEELKDDGRDLGDEAAAIGIATYSNSESTVLSNTSIFETLWLSQSKVLIPI